MDYALTPHRPVWLAPRGADPATPQAPHRWFALIDWMQLPEPTRRRHPLAKQVPDAASVALFAGCFAEPALALSPVLMALSEAPEALARQVEALDAACHTLPILSLLHTPATLAQLTQHLQSLLRIEADGTPYLLRLADTQMLAAAQAVLTAAQRARFFSGISAWWATDHQSQLHDLASGDREQPAAPLPLTLDTDQTHALLAAASLPMMASQMRHLDSLFGQTLTHAQQMAFVQASAAVAREEGLQDEAQLLRWTLQRWHAGQGTERPPASST